MTVFIALLRGVNVGGRSKLAMADLRAIAGHCGFEHVQTYVQSGNVVFRAPGAAKDVAAALRAGIADATSLDPAVAIRTARQLDAVIDGCPFEDTANVHVSFVVEGAAAPRSIVGGEPRLDAFLPERVAPRRRETYLYLPNGLGRSRLAQALGRGRAAEVMTTRNWRTVTALAALAAAA